MCSLNLGNLNLFLKAYVKQIIKNKTQGTVDSKHVIWDPQAVARWPLPSILAENDGDHKRQRSMASIFKISNEHVG